MPKNKGKGGKNRRRGKNENEATKRELDLKEEGQEYAQVLKILGNGRIRCFCFDGKERLCNIRGKLRKKVWINTSDIILLGLRDFQDEKADVIQKYNPDEARRLKAQGHIPEHIKLDADGGNKDDDNIHFANDEDDVVIGEDGQPIPREDDVGQQPDRSLPAAGGYIQGLSDITDSDEEESSDNDDDDDDEEYDYTSYALTKPQASYGGKQQNKKEFSIDNI